MTLTRRTCPRASSGCASRSGATPAKWVDLHALIDDERVFRDDVGHMFRAGCERVVAEVAPRVRASLAARMGR